MLRCFHSPYFQIEDYIKKMTDIITETPTTPACEEIPAKVPTAPKKPRKSKAKSTEVEIELRPVGVKTQAISGGKKPYIMTEKRKAAFAKCQAARKANLESRRPPKPETDETMDETSEVAA